jgi:hypothetical protein
MKTVTTLWLNNNKLSDSDAIMDAVAKSFPNITYLSMLRNPVVPDLYSSDSEAEAYQRHRYYVIHRLAKLQFLDASAVTPVERYMVLHMTLPIILYLHLCLFLMYSKEAEKRGKFLRVAKPAGSPTAAVFQQPMLTVLRSHQLIHCG